VLLTRNHPTIIYPETALTFAVQSPVMISTAQAPGAYRYVGAEDYDRDITRSCSRVLPSVPVVITAVRRPIRTLTVSLRVWSLFLLGLGPGFGMVIRGGRGWYGRRW